MRLKLKAERDSAAQREALEASKRAHDAHARKEADLKRRMVQAQEAVKAAEKAAEAQRQKEVDGLRKSGKGSRWEEVIGQWNNVRGELNQSKLAAVKPVRASTPARPPAAAASPVAPVVQKPARSSLMVSHLHRLHKLGLQQLNKLLRTEKHDVLRRHVLGWHCRM